MKINRFEGIVLHSLPFRDYDQILTLMTPEEGIVKIFTKAARSKRRNLHSLLLPINHIEAVVKVGKSDLYPTQELSLINAFLPIREDFARLEAACCFLQTIRTTQAPAKKAPDVFLQLKYFLHKATSTLNPSALAASFMIKILNHEGVLQWNRRCAQCEKNLGEAYYRKGESFCLEHRPPRPLVFSHEEMNLLDHLLKARSFENIERHPVEKNLINKLSELMHFIYL